MNTLNRPSVGRQGRLQSLANRVVERSETLGALSDAEFRARADELRWRVRTGTPVGRLLVDGLSLVREASRRTLQMQHFPVQVMGGIAIFRGYVAEMQTGEGKTLTAALPAFLHGVAAKGCHVVTVNDYLARRDADWLRPIYEMLGLTVGCIQSEMEDDERRAAYACDITYGTAKELGFDFLRDRLRMGHEVRPPRRRDRLSPNAQDQQLVQRGHYFALIDEADSILIDEARTPLIIGLTQPNSARQATLLRWCKRTAEKLDYNVDYVYEPERRSVYLTDDGCRNVLLMAKPRLLDAVGSEDLYEHVEQALAATRVFDRDRDYVVTNDEVVIVDESTGRMMEGRKWQEGLHQAVEAKEQLPITPVTAQAARVTVQRFFRHYTHLGGMTGTAVPARRELRSSYKLKVIAIPTHRPCIRQGLPTRIFATQAAKRAAVVEQITALHHAGRAVLVGTPSVSASEALSERLSAAGIPHDVLNARSHEREAEIVKQAGRPQRVTIATNMAGRGTDIILAESVRGAGGLHVIATEMHSSARIDRQLVGRAARQGDPGSFQFFLSLEDELLRCLPDRRLARLQAKGRAGVSGQGSGGRSQGDESAVSQVGKTEDGPSSINPQPSTLNPFTTHHSPLTTHHSPLTASEGELPASWHAVFRAAQRELEKTHRKQRRELLKSEDRHADAFEKMGLDPFTEFADANS